MKPMHLVAAALFAAGGLALVSPAEAAPRAAAGVAVSGDLILVDHRDGDRDWRRYRGRDDDDWRRGRDRDDRDRRHHRQGKRDHDRGKHLGWERGRGHDRDWRRGRGHDRDWWRGRGHDRDWAKKRQKKWAKERRKWAKQQRQHRKEWAKQQRRWHARQHPRHPRWVGRPFRHDRYSVLREFDRYSLPPPWGGQFYAQSGNEIFLVDEATRMILDAFVFSDAFRR